MVTMILIQVRNDYLKKNFESLDLDTAIQLCCIEIRRFGFKNQRPSVYFSENIKNYLVRSFTSATFRFFRDMPQIALDKKSNFEYLEKEVGQKYFHQNRLRTFSRVSFL